MRRPHISTVKVPAFRDLAGLVEPRVDLGVGVADEVAGALTWYFRANHAKLVVDVTHLDGAPIDSSALDIAPGNRGWLFRSQIQFSF